MVRNGYGIFGQKLGFIVTQKPNSNKVFLSYLKTIVIISSIVHVCKHLFHHVDHFES